MGRLLEDIDDRVWEGMDRGLWDSQSPACITVGSIGYLTSLTPKIVRKRPGAVPSTLTKSADKFAGEEKGVDTGLQLWGSRSWLDQHESQPVGPLPHKGFWVRDGDGHCASRTPWHAP